MSSQSGLANGSYLRAKKATRLGRVIVVLIYSAMSGRVRMNWLHTDMSFVPLSSGEMMYLHGLK